MVTFVEGLLIPAKYRGSSDYILELTQVPEYTYLETSLVERRRKQNTIECVIAKPRAQNDADLAED